MSAQESRQELRILELMREYVARGWTQGMLSRDAQGDAVHPGDEAAVCWCLGGALIRAYHDVCGTTHLYPPPAMRARLQKSLEERCNVPVSVGALVQIAAVNDSIGMTRKKMLALLDEILEEAAESEPAEYPVPSAIWEAGVP